MITFSGSSKGSSRYGSSSISISKSAPAALGGAAKITATNGVEVTSHWNSPQRAVQLLERAPIVWCRRIGDSCSSPSDAGIGGVIVSPGAMACRFDSPEIDDDPVAHAVAAKYRLLVSQGEIGGIHVRDVFQGRCRVGAFSQAYNKPAGRWTPGNFLVDVYDGTQLIANKVEAPTQCGTIGTCKDLTTFSFAVTYFNGFDENGVGLPDRGHWKRQIHLFIRNGVKTTRLLDNIYGSSNNLADLYLWLLNNDGRTSRVQIDQESLIAAARFMDVNGFFWNGVLSGPTSIGDLMSKIGPYYMVRETKINGRYGLRPLLPVTPSGAIDTGPLQPKWIFDNEAIVDGSYTFQGVGPEARRPYKALAAWRQQGGAGLDRMIRTTAVIYDDTPDTAPTEEHDLTQSVTTEIHAARAMRFGQAKRRYITHTASATIKPGYHNSSLGEGELIEIRLDRTDLESNATDQLRELYWITSANLSRDGQLSLALEQCPVDASGRSLVARDVAAITAHGGIWPSGDTAPPCDADSSRATDCSIPPEDADSWTAEEVFFYSRHLRRPGPGEYVDGGFSSGPSPAPPAGPPGGSPGGGGGGGAPAAQPPTGPVEPPGIPAVPGTPSGPANPQLPPTGNQEYTVYTLRKYWRLNPEANIAFPDLMPEEKEEDMASIFTGPDDACFISFEDNNLTRVTLYPVDENTGATSPPVVYEYPHILNGSYQETWFYIFDRSVLIPGYA
jgi:hypothetical protein